MKEVKPVPEHRDILGNPLEIGSTVAVNHHKMEICTVTKINPKMLRVHPVRPKYRGDGFLKYPSDMVSVDPQLVTLYVLQQT
jgi:hypothetical protein